MTATRMIAAFAALATVLAIVPGVAVAANNEIDQGSFNADAESDEVFTNNADFGLGFGGGSPYGVWDAALAAANCQLMTVADAWVLNLAVGAALGVISDEDDIAIAATPLESHDGFGAFDAETATSTCATPVGQITIHVSPSPGWGEAAPHGGSWADVMSASHGGLGGGKTNSIDQGSFDASASLEEAVANQASFFLNAANGAASASNCQALVGAHFGTAVVGANVAAGQIEDSDTIVVAGEEGGLGTESAEFDTRLTIEVENDHVATSSCDQTIAGIDIVVGGS